MECGKVVRRGGEGVICPFPVCLFSGVFWQGFHPVCSPQVIPEPWGPLRALAEGGGGGRMGSWLCWCPGGAAALTRGCSGELQEQRDC